MSKMEEIQSGDSKLMVSFAIGRNRTIFVRGAYDAAKTTPVERLEFFDIIQRFGQEVSVELLTTFKASLMKVVLCEVDPGTIVFELETDQPAVSRRKAILTVQAAFEETASDAVFEDAKPVERKEMLNFKIPPNTWPMTGPSTLQ